jgi:hypothetical protein
MLAPVRGEPFGLALGHFDYKTAAVPIKLERDQIDRNVPDPTKVWEGTTKAASPQIGYDYVLEGCFHFTT